MLETCWKRGPSWQHETCPCHRHSSTLCASRAAGTLAAAQRLSCCEATQYQCKGGEVLFGHICICCHKVTGPILEAAMGLLCCGISPNVAWQLCVCACRGICSLQSKSSLSCDALIIIFTIDADTQWTVIMKVFFSTEDVHLQSLFELGHDMHFSFFSNICKLSHAYRRARHVSWPGGKM